MRNLPLISLALLMAAFAMLFRTATASDEIYNEDYILIVAGYHMLEGDVLLRDFTVNPYESLSLLMALAQGLLGNSLLGYFLVFVGMFAATVALVSLIAGRLTGSLAVAAVAALVVILMDVRVINSYKVFALALGVATLVAYGRRPSAALALALGLVAGFAAFLRIDLGLIVGIGAATAILIAGWRHWLTTFLGHTAAASIGFLLVIGPWAGFMASQSALGDYVTTVLKLNYAPEPTPIPWVQAWLPVPEGDLWTPTELTRAPSKAEVTIASGVGPSEIERIAAEFGLSEGRYVKEDEAGELWTFAFADPSRELISKLLADPRVVEVNGTGTASESLPLRPYRDIPLSAALGVLFDQDAVRSVAYYATWLGVLVLAALAIVGPFTRQDRNTNDEFATRPPIGILLPLIVLLVVANIQLIRGAAVSGVRLQDVSVVTAVSWALALSWIAGSANAPRLRHLLAGAVAVALLLICALYGETDNRLQRKMAALLQPLEVGFGGLRTSLHRLALSGPELMAMSPNEPREAIAGYLRSCLRADRRYFSPDYTTVEVGFFSERLIAGGHIYFYPRYPAGALVTDAETVERLKRQRPPVVFGQARSGVYYNLIPKYYPLTWAFLQEHYVDVTPNNETFSSIFDAPYYFLWHADTEYSRLDPRLGLPCLDSEPIEDLVSKE